MADYREFLDALEEGVKALAGKTAKGFGEEATTDARQFLKGTEADLKRWTELLAEGRLTRKDFEWLVKGKEDLARMRALKLAGLARVRIDRFRKSLLDLVINTAFTVFL